MTAFLSASARAFHPHFLLALLVACLLGGSGFSSSALAADGADTSPLGTLLARPTGPAPITPEQARTTIAQAKSLAASQPGRQTEIDAYLIPYQRVLEPGAPPASAPKPYLILKKATGGTEVVKAQSANLVGEFVKGTLPDGSSAAWQKAFYLGYVPWYTDQELDSPAGVAPADLDALAANYDAQAAAFPEVRALLGLEAQRLRHANVKLKERAARWTQDLQARRARIFGPPYDPQTAYTSEGLAKMLLDAEALRHDDRAPEQRAKLDARIAPFRQHFENLLAGKEYANGAWHDRQELDAARARDENDAERRRAFETSLTLAVDARAVPAANLAWALELPAAAALLLIVLGFGLMTGKRSVPARLCGLVLCAAPVVLAYAVWRQAQTGGPSPMAESAVDLEKVSRLLYQAAHRSGPLPPDQQEAQLSDAEVNAFLNTHLHFVNTGGAPSTLDVRRAGWEVRLKQGGLTLLEWDQWLGGLFPVQYDLAADGSEPLSCRAVRIGGLTAPASLQNLLWENLSAQLSRLPQANTLLALYPRHEWTRGGVRLAAATPEPDDTTPVLASAPPSTPEPAPNMPAAVSETPAPAVSTTPPDEAEGAVIPARALTDAEMHEARGYSNTFSDTWAATDGLGRTVANAGKAGPPPTGKRAVGIFYFLWHQGIPKIFDDTKILAANPTNPQWGPTPQHHWWGEPYLGYYRAEDPWLIRKHAQMLSDAGVDVIICDTTNAITYPSACQAICKVYTQMRKEGCQTPQIAFMLNAKTDKTAQLLYDELYGPNHFPDLWYRWQGKPLLLAQPDEVPKAIRDFFTIKRSWAWTGSSGWFGDGKDKWPWLDNYPQNYGWSANRAVPEELSMCVAQHPTGNYGRSHIAGHEPPEAQQDPAKGIAFAEQFQQVMKVKPEFLFITGWNEWHASRFIKGPKSPASQFLGKPLKDGDSFWVDEYSQEFSRDIEPQRGHFEDNYYYQMVSYIRQYKGVRPPPKPSASKMINSFEDWKDVGPDYLDDIGDTAPRNFPGCGEEGIYKNNEGRNDLVRAKVARSMSTIWFYVETRKDLTAPDGKNWMQLLINSDSNPGTGWFGYDYVVNRQPPFGNNAVLERYDNDRKAWVEAARVPIRTSGNRLYVGIPRSAVNGFREQLKFEFKWADNVPLDELKSPAGFMDHGDVAPNARFNYIFSERD